MSDSKRSRSRHSPASSYSSRKRSTTQSISGTEDSQNTRSASQHSIATRSTGQQSYLSSVRTDHSRQSDSTHGLSQVYEPNFLSLRRNTRNLRDILDGPKRVNVHDLYVDHVEENGFLGTGRQPTANGSMNVPNNEVVAVSKYLTRLRAEMGEDYGDNDSEYEEDVQSTQNKRQRATWLENSKNRKVGEKAQSSDDSDEEYVEEASSESSSSSSSESEDAVLEESIRREKEDNEVTSLTTDDTKLIISNDSTGATLGDEDELYFPGDTSSEEEEDEVEEFGFEENDTFLDLPELYSLEEEDDIDEDDEDDFVFDDDEENALHEQLEDVSSSSGSSDNDEIEYQNVPTEIKDQQYDIDVDVNDDDDDDDDHDYLEYDGSDDEDERHDTSSSDDDEDELSDLWDEPVSNVFNISATNPINATTSIPSVPPKSIDVNNEPNKDNWLSYLRMDDTNDEHVGNIADHRDDADKNIANDDDELDWDVDWDDGSTNNMTMVATTVTSAPPDRPIIHDNVILSNRYGLVRPRDLSSSLDRLLPQLLNDDNDDDDDEYQEQEPKRMKKDTRVTRTAAASLISQLAELPVVATAVRPRLIFQKPHFVQFGANISKTMQAVRMDGFNAYLQRILEQAPFLLLQPSLLESHQDWNAVASKVASCMYSPVSLKSAIQGFLATAHGLNPLQDVGLRAWTYPGSKKPINWVTNQNLYILQNTTDEVFEKQKHMYMSSVMTQHRIIAQPEHLSVLLGMISTLRYKTDHLLAYMGQCESGIVTLRGRGSYVPSTEHVTSIYSGIKEWHPLSQHPSAVQFKRNIRLPLYRLVSPHSKANIQTQLSGQSSNIATVTNNTALLPLLSEIHRNPLKISSNRDITQIIGVVPSADVVKGIEMIAGDVVEKYRHEQFHNLRNISDLKEDVVSKPTEDMITLRVEAAMNRDWSHISARFTQECREYAGELNPSVEQHVRTVYGRIMSRSHASVLAGLQKLTSVDSITVNEAMLWHGSQTLRLTRQAGSMLQLTLQHGILTARENQKYAPVGKTAKKESPTFVTSTEINNCLYLQASQCPNSEVLQCFPRGVRVPCVEELNSTVTLADAVRAAIQYKPIASVIEFINAVSEANRVCEATLTRGEQSVLCAYSLSQYNVLYNECLEYTFCSFSCPSLETSAQFREVPLFTRPADVCITLLDQRICIPPLLAYNFIKYTLPAHQFDLLLSRSLQRAEHGCVIPTIDKPVDQLFKPSRNVLYSVLIPQATNTLLRTPGAAKLFAAVSGRVMVGEYPSVMPQSIDPLAHLLMQQQQQPQEKLLSIYSTCQCKYNHPVLTIPMALSCEDVPLLSQYHTHPAELKQANPLLYLQNTFIPSYVCFSGLCIDQCVCRFAPLAVEQDERLVHTFITSPLPFFSCPSPRVSIRTSVLQVCPLLTLLQLLQRTPWSRKSRNSIDVCMEMLHIPKYALHPALFPLQDVDLTASPIIPRELAVPVSLVLAKPRELTAKQQQTQRMLSQYGVFVCPEHYALDPDTPHGMYSHLTLEATRPLQTRVLYSSKWSATDYGKWTVDLKTGLITGPGVPVRSVHNLILSLTGPVDTAIPIIHVQQWRLFLSGLIETPLFITISNVRQVPVDPSSLYSGIHIVYSSNNRLSLQGKRVLTNLLRPTQYLHDEDRTTSVTPQYTIPRELLILYPTFRRFQVVQTQVHFIQPLLHIPVTTTHPLQFAYPRHSGIPWVILGFTPFFTLQQFQKTFTWPLLTELGLAPQDILSASDLNELFQHKIITFAQLCFGNPFNSVRAALDVFTISCLLLARPDKRMKIILQRHPPTYNVHVDTYKLHISKWFHGIMRILDLTNLPRQYNENRIVHNEEALSRLVETTQNTLFIRLKHVHNENTLFAHKDESMHYSSLYLQPNPLQNYEDTETLPRAPLMGAKVHHPAQASYLRNRRDLLTPRCPVGALAFLHEDHAADAELQESNIILDAGRVTRSRTNALPGARAQQTVGDMLSLDELVRAYDLPPLCPPVPTSRNLFVKYKQVSVSK